MTLLNIVYEIKKDRMLNKSVFVRESIRRHCRESFLSETNKKTEKRKLNDNVQENDSRDHKDI